MTVIYDPSQDAFVDVLTLEPRARAAGEKMRPEWLGRVNIAGIIITPERLREIFSEPAPDG
jgi:hypothetical protein